MSNIQKTITYGFIVFCVSVTAGSLAMAQTYNWIPIGTIGAKWSSNGVHIYNTNAGSVVINDTLPSGTLTLDVNGGIGASEYCDQNGDNCFQSLDVERWRYNLVNNDLYVRSTSTQVGIGVTTPTQKLHVGGNVLADAYLYSSDIHLKTNIQPLSGMDIISQLQGVRFDWIDTGESEVGVIAQQVEKVLPELVVTDETTGNKLVQYSNLVAPLIAAVNEQQKTIDRLRAELDALQK